MARNDEPGMPKAKKPTSGSGKWTKYQRNYVKGDADWAKVDEALILAALSSVTAEGAALLFGTTRDKGALVLTVCDGDERVKLYASTREEMNEHLRSISDLI
jgi:hypothetical protein